MKNYVFHIVGRDIRSVTIQTMQCCASMATMVTRKRHNVLCYTYVAYLLYYIL